MRSSVGKQELSVDLRQSTDVPQSSSTSTTTSPLSRSTAQKNSILKHKNITDLFPFERLTTALAQEKLVEESGTAPLDKNSDLAKEVLSLERYDLISVNVFVVGVLLNQRRSKSDSTFLKI